MSGQPDPRLRASLKIAAGAAGAAVSLLGALVLLGWALDIGPLKSLRPDWVTMKANAALAFLLAGASLRVLGAAHGPRLLRRFGHAGAVLVALVGGLTLLEYVLGWDLGIDQLLVQEPPGAVGTVSPGRMAPTTAINFVFLGSALLLLVRPWGIRMAQWLALSVAGIGVLNLLGYTYGVPALYDLPAATAMAAHTAVAFVLLGLGILCAQPDRGVMATLTSPGVGGVMMREVLREIKWHPVYRTVPAVILTTSQEEVDVRTCYELGVNSYILKPVDFDKFLEVVGRIDLYWVLTNHPPPAAAPRHPDRPRAKGSVPQPEGFGPQATRRPREDV